MNSLIYLSTCSSTQDEVIDFINSNHLNEDFIAIYTFNQTHGRGQYGNIWESYPHENLAYSFAIKTKNNLRSNILFNYYTAIVVRDFIANLTQEPVSIKWPNDLILKNKKISGMIFEKKGDFLITGIGVNILQKNFQKLPKASSILTQTHLAFDLENFANSFHQYLFQNLVQKLFPKNIVELYNQNLYKKDEITVFEKNQVRQNGIIKHADEEGYLWIELENEGLQKFFHKEIEMLY